MHLCALSDLVLKVVLLHLFCLQFCKGIHYTARIFYMLPIFQLQCGVSVCEELNCEATRGSLTLSGSYTAEIQVWFFFFF